ncbi:MAG TPA: Nif3-like dinuclear metal center hexameric protein [Candidatus Riflebacteria bacterium]|nr:Nif3-like dinuclear metal center hexameric protein [Candidatus Riflebacteria bacterium]
MVQRNEIVTYLNEVFAEVSFPDYSYNGLQFEGSEQVSKIAAGVDATNEFFAESIKQGADFALVHHGLFWKGAEWSRLDRINQRIVKTLMSGDLNLFAMHLPLDAHPKFGNNAILAGLLKAKVIAPFGGSRGNAVGMLARFAAPITLQELNQRIEKAIGPIATSLEFGKKKIQTIGILSGGGWSSVTDPLVYNGEVDAILTGEIVHQAVAACRDRQVHMISAGHYATEVFGARELGKHLAKKFGLEFVFVDLPTGL